MHTVQLLVQTETCANDLRALLQREGYEAIPCLTPDLTREGPIVADRGAMERCPGLLDIPERVVVIAPNDSKFLAVLWQHQMQFVVFETDKPATVLLAILGASIGGGDVKARAPCACDRVVIH